MTRSPAPIPRRCTICRRRVRPDRNLCDRCLSVPLDAHRTCSDCPALIPFQSTSDRCVNCRREAATERMRAYREKWRAEGPKPPKLADIDIGRGTGWDCLHLPDRCDRTHCRHHVGLDGGPDCAVKVANARGEMMLLATIGDLLNLTRERIRQIERQGLRNLRRGTTATARAIRAAMETP